MVGLAARASYGAKSQAPILMTHIAPDAIKFLSELRENNERAWFTANKSRYEDARHDLAVFVDNLIGEIAAFDPGVIGMEGKDCVFRIYRDTRFAKDKTPYKTNMGAHIVAGGRKNEMARAGYYLHLEPGGCFLGGGAHHPPSDWMAAIRRSIERDGDKLRKIAAARDFKKYFGAISGEQIKTAPRGYAKDHPEIDLLRYKSLVAVHEIKDKDVSDPGFLKHAGKVFKAMKPFEDFLNAAW